jgi:mannose-6-phosphate isomerase-like protein (cupin superfamily)
MTEEGQEVGNPRQGQETIKSVRPWGDIFVVVRNQMCSVDLTHVRPGSRASLHRHDVRAELFHFIDDGAYLELDGEVCQPKAGDEFLILPGTEHRFWAGDTPFHMLVVSFGEWQAQDQERIEDDYGRAGQQVVL